jgi:hypothetical protein
MTTTTRTRPSPAQSAEQRRTRQDELLATLADGVQALTTSDRVAPVPTGDVHAPHIMSWRRTEPSRRRSGWW